MMVRRTLRRLLRPIALATTLFLLAGTVSCGYFLYPERRGRAGGHIDAPVLIMDLLWLLPGIIPGVVALAIDFSSGAIYVGGGRRAHRVKPEGRLTVKVPTLRRETDLELRLVSESGRILGSDARTVAAGAAAALTIDLAAAKRVAARQGVRSRAVELQLFGPDGRRARLPLELL